MSEPLSIERVSEIVRLFQAGLGRSPEPTAIRHFGVLFEGGATFHDVAHLIAGSAEFRKLHGAEDVCDRAFAAYLYRNGLGRDPDPQGEAHLMALPNRGEALVFVAGSDEARNRADLFDLLYPNGASPLDGLAYRSWLRRYDRLSTTDRLAIGRHIDRGMKTRPRLSLMIQITPSRIDLFEETVASLEAQIYPEWSLFVVCPEDMRQGNRQALQKIVRRVPGVIEIQVPPHMDVEERWSTALARADGAYCGFLEPGDTLAPTALYEFAVAIENAPGLALVYCDEDRRGSDGERCEPCFKTGWNPELVYAGDVIGQLAMFSRDLALKVGGIRDSVGVYARYDLILRLTEGRTASEISHLSRVLFHRGRRPGLPLTFPQVRTTKRFPEIRQVVQRHLEETQPGCQLEDVYVGGNVWPRLVRPLQGSPLVSFIIPTKNRPDLLEKCVSSLLELTDYDNFEILIVDNGSSRPEALDLLRRFERNGRIKVIRIPEAFNWSALNNRAAEHANGEFLLFLNDDTEILEESWLGEMLSHGVREGIGVVGSRLFYQDGTIQHAGMVLTARGARHILRSAQPDEPGYLGQLVLVRDMMAVTGACMMVRKDVFQKMGGFDETFPLTCNDVEFCLRVRQSGLRVLWTPHASLMHVDGATRGPDHSPKKIINACLDVGRLLDRWEGAMTSDPFLNDNLTATDHNLILATPPRDRRPWRRQPTYMRAISRS